MPVAVTLASNKQPVLRLSVGVTGPPGPVGPAGSETVTKIAAQALGGGRIVKLLSSGQVDYASNSAMGDAMAVFGLTLGATSAGGNVNVQKHGDVVDGAFAFSPGIVYLGTSGIMTQTYPSAGAFVLIVGEALSATRLFVNIREPIFL